MHNYWIESRGQSGVFSADVLHHPVQIYMPELNTGFCILQDEARKTRAQFLAEAQRTGALVMSCHFPPPACGYVRRDGEGYSTSLRNPATPNSSTDDLSTDDLATLSQFTLQETSA